MKPVYRWTALLGMALLCGCGGGGGSSSSDVSTSSASHTFSTSSPNVVAIAVAPGPAAAGYQTFNIPLVTVTVCEPGTSTCATIPDVLVDTGSSGLRLMASVLAANNLTLTPTADPDNSGNTINECVPFADGYSWGEVATATVTIAGERTAAAIPVQVINDSATPSPAAPSSCASGVSRNSINAFDANGVLGIGVFNQDCGNGCVGSSNSGNDVYYTCTSGGVCSSTAQALADQVSNPAASFPTDNNGVIVQLPAISAAGAASASGYLVFGIGTETNNGLGDANVLTVNYQGNFTTTYNGQALGSSFIDSGSNGLYFPNSSTSPIALCGSSGGPADFYCPSSTLTLSAVNQGANGNSNTASFQIADLNNISDSNFAIDDVGGPASTTGVLGAYFDWGLPFFYGNTIFNAIEGRTAAGTVGPYYAY